MLLAAAGAAAWAQSISTKPSDDLPRTYKTQRDWAEVPGSGKPGRQIGPLPSPRLNPHPMGPIYVIYRCREKLVRGKA